MYAEIWPGWYVGAAYFRVPSSIDRINSVVSLLSYAVQVVMLGSYHHHLLHHAMPCHVNASNLLLPILRYAKNLPSQKNSKTQNQ